VLIVDGTMVPTRDHTVAEQSKNYRYSTDRQVVIDTDSRLVVAVGRTTVIADGGYRGAGLVIRHHRRERGQTELPVWKEEHNTSHRKVRARVEHRDARQSPTAQPCPCGITPAPRDHLQARPEGDGSPDRRLGGRSVETELVALDVLHHQARLVVVIGKQ
jgi:hypothetical protein